ncbi:peroxidase family protein [Sediminicoccus sp. BL-A-41-H5]|uniref:peroxidase family protein n=1 Tax=Sediminicoccus sp. BL-A-41-H5 TaxID=3421106 RepID=UPI003D679939
MPTLSLADIRFLLARSRGEWLPEELNGLAPLGPTGIRDVQGVGNNTLDAAAPGFWFGAADTLFTRDTFNRLVEPSTKNDIISAPFANSPRGATSVVTIGDTTNVGGKIADALNPRNISNLIADSSAPVGFQSLDPADPNYALKLELSLQDNPVGRISPVSGAINPLAYSNWMSQFGQFFDHGLDFVSKGKDGRVSIELLPSDGLYTAGRATTIAASRNNTTNVTIGEGSTDALLSKLGILADQGKASWAIKSTLTTPDAGAVVDGFTYAYVGTLVLNNTLIEIQALDEADLVAQINAFTPTTGVVASAAPFPAIGNLVPAGSFNFTLTPARAESFNQISPFIDLSQTYGSDKSKTFFLREYQTLNAGQTIHDVTTGRLVNAGATVNGEVASGIANWAQIKANAAKVGITLHDADITAVPMLAIDQFGQLILSADGRPQLVALDKVTGETVYVTDTTVAEGLVLMTTQHAFLNDMGVRLPALTDTTVWAGRDLIGPTKAALEAHYVAGDGRLNENIGLTAVQEVFVNEHNRVLTDLKAVYGFEGDQPAGGWTWTDPLTGVATKVTAEELFQQAKLFNEMTYQHLVFDQFVRKLSPNIAGFAGVDPLIDARISSEFANAVYRLGHSMLPETVGMRKVSGAENISTVANSDVVTVTMVNHGLADQANITLSSVDNDIGGLAANLLNGTFAITRIDASQFSITVNGTATATATGLVSDKVQIDINKGLIEAFLSPTSYIPGSSAALITDGSTAQVGNRIDEKVTDALRDNLLGQPLDLATLNIVRGRDAGLPTLNEMRAAIQTVAPLALQATLNPYTSWTGFRDNLKGSPLDQAATVKNFMMAYASDDILTKFASTKTLTQWYALREFVDAVDQALYMATLKNATEAAYADTAWMSTTGNRDFNRIDAWMGGLAEREVLGGMLGSTFDAVFAMQMMKLQNGDHFYYLGRVPTTEFFIENMEGVQLADIVMRSTGATNVYADIFSVADKYVLIDDADGQPSVGTFDELLESTTTQQVFDTAGNIITASIGRAGYVNGVFYGNPGDYVDARNVLNPNGIGNASERITGTAVNDTVFGLGGNDDIRGEDGDDSLVGDAGVDFLYGDGGNDTLDGGIDNDFMYGGAGNDSMLGGLGADIMFGNADNDIMFGGAEADVMQGGAGDDVMYGGDGVVDLNGVLDPDAPLTAALLDDGLNGGAGNDTLYGGGGWDNLAGASGHDMLVPGAGGLVIGGREVMNGGEGDDIYIIEDSLAFVHHDIADNGLTQLQLVNKGPGFRVANGLGIDEVRFTQTVADSIILGGTNALGIVSAFSGIERVVIGTGTANAADRTGTAAINIDASLAVPGLNVGLEMLGNAGANIFVGTAFNDTLDGGAGIDILEGGLGNDTYIIDVTTDTVVEGLLGAGTDTVIVNGAFNYTLAADLENLTLRSTALEGTGNAQSNIILGNASNNILLGLGGNDSIDGGAGADRINGGAGVDRLTGGAGNDTFVFGSVAEIGNNAAFRETITDFAAGDVLDFTAIDANTGVAGTQGFTLVQGAALAQTAAGAGQLRYANGVLQGFVNADAIADFSINLTGAPTLTGSSFIQRMSVAGPVAAVAEGSTGVSQHVFTVSVPTVVGTNTTVNWAVTGSGANAANAADFQGGVLPTGTLTIQAGQSSGTITISVVGDTTVEANETFTLTLSNPSTGIVLGTATATSTILNDDVAGLLLNGTAAANALSGGAGNDTINGLAGNDLLSGLGGADQLFGGDGNDILDGGAGNDTLDGGAGVDFLTGGADADVFAFGAAIAEIGLAAGSRDTITDFESGIDKIDLSLIDANANVAGNQAFTFVNGAFTGLGQVRFVNQGGVRTLEGNTTGNNNADFAILIGNVATVLGTDIIL